jgi:hypothetical protein
LPSATYYQIELVSDFSGTEFELKKNIDECLVSSGILEREIKINLNFNKHVLDRTKIFLRLESCINQPKCVSLMELFKYNLGNIKIYESKLEYGTIKDKK